MSIRKTVQAACTLAAIIASGSAVQAVDYYRAVPHSATTDARTAQA
jgi:hypothetical protein